MKRAGGIGFGAVTIFLILVTAFCCVGTVRCVTDLSAQEREEYYRAKEKSLASEMRRLLDIKGFQNSGVMLTHVTEADGSRFYTMVIHHAGIGRLCAEDRGRLQEELEGFVLKEGSGLDCKILIEKKE